MNPKPYRVVNTKSVQVLKKVLRKLDYTNFVCLPKIDGWKYSAFILVSQGKDTPPEPDIKLHIHVYDPKLRVKVHKLLKQHKIKEVTDGML